LRARHLEFRLRTPVPEPATRLLDEAMALHRNERLAEAALRYRQVVRIEPRQIEALRLLGSMHFGQGNFTEAERWFRKAVKIDGRSADAHIELGPRCAGWAASARRRPVVGVRSS
jgi:cytochrome c-type biogenesis protein CcmH/NrfG